jgi:hypothetical protein
MLVKPGQRYLHRMRRIRFLGFDGMIELSGEAAVDAGEAFGEVEDVVDNRVADVAVEIAQLGFGFAIDGDAERGDSL